MPENRVGKEKVRITFSLVFYQLRETDSANDLLFMELPPPADGDART